MRAQRRVSCLSDCFLSSVIFSLINSNFSQACFAPGQVAGGHSHADMSEVFFVESGLGNIRINGIDYQLKPGVCIAVEPGEVHEVSNTGNTDLIITYFGLRS